MWPPTGTSNASPPSAVLRLMLGGRRRQQDQKQRTLLQQDGWGTAAPPSFIVTSLEKPGLSRGASVVSPFKGRFFSRLVNYAVQLRPAMTVNASGEGRIQEAAACQRLLQTLPVNQGGVQTGPLLQSRRTSWRGQLGLAGCLPAPR